MTDRNDNASRWFAHYRAVLRGEEEPMVVADRDMQMVVITPPHLADEGDE